MSKQTNQSKPLQLRVLRAKYKSESLGVYVNSIRVPVTFSTTAGRGEGAVSRPWAQGHSARGRKHALAHSQAQARVVIQDSSLGPSGNPWIEVLREFLRVFGIWWYPKLGDFDSKEGQLLKLGTKGFTWLPKYEKIIIPVHQKGSSKYQWPYAKRQWSNLLITNYRKLVFTSPANLLTTQLEVTYIGYKNLKMILCTDITCK